MGGKKDFLKKQKCLSLTTSREVPPASKCGCTVRGFGCFFHWRELTGVLVFRPPEELETLRNKPTDRKHLSVPGSSHLHCSLHMWAFAVLPNDEFSRWRKKKENTWRGKISWKAGALSKIVALYKQALWWLICIGKTTQGVTLWILVASGESRMSMIKSMCLQLVGVEDVQVA